MANIIIYKKEKMIHQIEFNKGVQEVLSPKNNNKIYNKIKERITPTKSRLIPNHHMTKKRERSENMKKDKNTNP
jgi:hypothetical protein